MKKVASQTSDVISLLKEFKEIAEQEILHSRDNTMERVLTKYEERLKEAFSVESVSTQIH
ncbi:hypothetical protein CN918_25350 [Priestia megaterium]|nr:hypothetical protein CN918_25350 [Priestia megaterium]